MKILVALVIAAAVAGIAQLVFIAIARRESRLERRLAGYEPLQPTHAGSDDMVDLSPDTKVVTQALEMTRDFAARTGVLTRVEMMLEQADVPIRAAEFLFYVPLLAAVAGVVAGVGISWLTGGVIAVAVGVVPFAIVSVKRGRRLKAFDEQLPDTLNLLASSIRAGFSFMQGLEAVAHEASEPMQRELHRVFTEARLGRSVDEALEDCATRMESADLHWVVMALRIQREVGGNLAELLVTVADTMMHRERLRREVRALTAEGRFSAIILSAMPFFFLAVFQVLAPDYVPHLFHNGIGVACLIGAGIGNVVGWVWLRRIVDIKV